MDLDAFVARHRASWDRLDRLTSRRRLTGAEADELVDLYQRTATHLSVVRSSSPDPALVGRLSQSVARGRAAVAGAHTPAWRDVSRFVTVGFPVAVYRARWWWLAAGAGFTLAALAVGAWVAGDPQVQAALLPPEEVRQLVDQEFADYYTSAPAGSFAARVWTNNVWAAAAALILGALFVLPAVWVLWQNALNVGIVGGLMVANGRGDVFFGLITPHGLLELTAVFVAAGVGMRLGWTIIDPGPRPRSVALAQEGRAAVTVALGLVVVLFLSGLIEAFVTPSGLPTAARIVVGVMAWAGFLAYVVVLGRRADRAGITGDVEGSASATDIAPYAA
ncbi:MAG: stage II sporulation protein M [Candidatus Nanopelagicales bacterium]